MNILIAVFTSLLFLLYTFGSDDDYYKLLEVEKNADLRDIRKAFKRLAVIMHPDKSPDDKDAHKNFLKIAEAYETLKDPTKRREYDMYGKRGNQGSQPRYHSYTYYRDQFGIYDDDPLIVTLSGDDYDSSVADGVWFVNFYSPQCSHCHHLAPEWRKLSELLEGVVRIAAVNCEDDFNLCWRLNLRAYPTLLFYGEEATSLQGQEYHGDRKSRPMERFVMEHLAKSTIPTIKSAVDINLSPWALLNCAAGDCLEENTQLKLASLLRGLVSVGIIKDKKVLKKFTTKEDATVIFYTNDNNKVELFRSDYKELADDILGLLPEAQQVLVDDFQEIRNKLRKSDDENPWLLCFAIGQDTEHQVIMKQLPALLKNFNIGQINCGRSSGLCQSLHISKYPTWGILKSGGAFEVFHGRESLHAIKKFAHETQEAKNLQALSPQDLKRIMQEGSAWVIGWLLAGCPPCKKMLPALRKASKHFSPSEIQFGTVDCAIHSHVCRQYNVNAYPHVGLYNQSREATYQDSANENNIVEFIEQMKYNYVKELTLDNFNSEIGSKSESEVWVVEFYAPWCKPCQKLQPEWRKLAKKLSHLDNVYVGSVDCVVQSLLCSQQGIRSYPTIWMYPPGSKGLSSIAFYGKGQPKELNNLLKWVFSFMQNSLTTLTSESFGDVIENSKHTKTWMVMFFAPWCGYCHEFEPEFITASQILKDKVNAAKVDCQSNGALCQKQNINAYPSVKLYQRTNGVTRTTAGIPLHSGEADQLVQEIRSVLADAFVTELDHDEL